MIRGIARKPLSALALGLLAIGCDELSEFRTGPDEVYRGEVVGSDTGPTDGSFIRDGFPSFTTMELTFDPEAAAREVGDAGLQSPGSIDTSFPCPRDRDDCEEGAPVAGPFRQASLEPIQNLSHDALSQYDFPGGGRIRNYIFHSRFDSGTASAPRARNAMVFLSLMENGKIEVRVIAPALGPAGGEGSGADDAGGALFGVFVLERQRR